MVLQFSRVALANRTKSSAKKRWEKAGPLFEVFTFIQRCSLHFSSINYPRNSMHRIKRYGESGSPCLIPLEGQKGSIVSPLKSSEVVTEEM